MSRVWVLGAGFSRSLGGPLLADLFSPDLLVRTKATFPERQYPALHGPAAVRVQRLYLNDGGTGARSTWADAEDFLDRLDLAARAPQSPTARWLAGLIGGDPDFAEIAEAARLLVAAQCSGFLEDSDTTTERWDPYRKWAGELGASDTLISFNYDTLIERLGSAIQVADPRTETVPGPRLMKLHGSVDWVIDGQADGQIQAYQVKGLPHSAFRRGSTRLAIAAPGPTKREMVDSLFPRLWQQAQSAVRDAGAIVFLGYRFPETDSAARRRLLGALESNENNHVELHTVLGDDVNHKHSTRLRGLLQHAVRKRSADTGRGLPGVKSVSIEQHPLFVQDFVDIAKVGYG